MLVYVEYATVFKWLRSVFSNICTFLSNYPGEKITALFGELKQAKKGSLCAGEKFFTSLMK